jgi:signal transduction histidine kinase
MTSELVSANRRLELKNEQLEEFVYVASHDLKSPLRTISSFAQMLEIEQGALLGEGGTENLGYIQTAAARMHLLIEDLQTYLRIDSEHQPDTSVDIGPLLKELVAFHEPLLTDAGAVVVFVPPFPLVLGSELHLRQVFDNLITNAVHYRHPDRKLRIEINQETVGDRLRIHVDDNGIGIPSEYRLRVLRVFERLDTSTEGTGMGLAICVRIARTYGGELTIDESPLGGTRVTVTLNIDPAPT